MFLCVCQCMPGIQHPSSGQRKMGLRVVQCEGKYTEGEKTMCVYVKKTRLKIVWERLFTVLTRLSKEHRKSNKFYE